MKKVFLIVALLAGITGAANGTTLYKIMCADGTIHYCYGISCDLLSPGDADEYKEVMINMTCECHGGGGYIVQLGTDTGGSGENNGKNDKVDLNPPPPRNP